VSKGDFKKKEKSLRGLFDNVHYDPEVERLDVTGAREIEGSPQEVINVLNRLATLLKEGGRGKIMLQCETSEICYFRQNMWEVMSVHLPPDPFDDIHHVA